MSEPMDEMKPGEPIPPDEAGASQPYGQDPQNEPQPGTQDVPAGDSGPDQPAEPMAADGAEPEARPDETGLAVRDADAADGSDGPAADDGSESSLAEWQTEYDGGYNYEEPSDLAEYEDDYEDDYEDEEDELDEVGQKKMTLIEHLDELRKRIIRAVLGLAIGMVAALVLSPWAIGVIIAPYEAATGEKLKAIDMISPFMVYMRISLYMGFLMASPWIFYQMWMFVAAGLYKHERKYVTYAVPFSAVLFISGALFFLFYISWMIMGAFAAFNNWMGVGMNVTLDNHVNFMTNMMLVFGFCFQMPVAVLLLGKMGLVTVKSLGRYRKYVIVGILILAALVTSPSPLDQLALAIPMWLLYELGVLLVYLLIERKQREEDKAAGYEPIED